MLSLFKSLSNRAKSIQPHHALTALILLNIFVGLTVGQQFGESWDETVYYLYGEKSLDAYIRGIQGLELIPNKHIYFANLRYYGPFYAVSGKVMVDFVTHLLKNWSYEDIWHFVNFGFFQVGVIGIYIIAKRFMHKWRAFWVALLFAAQPLLFGHAFMNPKDIPFMTFFTASIATGFIFFEAVAKKVEAHKTSSTQNQKYSLIFSLILGLYAFSIAGRDIISSLIGNLVSFIYYADPNTILGKLFSLLADKGSRLRVENYIHKAVSARIDLLFLGAVLLFVIIKWFLDNRPINRNFPDLTQAIRKIDLSLIIKLLTAGIVLGLTTSVRLLGPFAGFLLIGYALISIGRKSLPSVIWYLSIATIVTYITWPFLWDSPAFRFIKAFDVMKEFPFEAPIRFMGKDYFANNLPWMYIPALIAIQLTEPAVILFSIGFVGSLWSFITKFASNKKLLVIFGWFLLPIGLFIALHSSAYDNFRQFFFVLPPIFILAGVGLESILIRIDRKIIKPALTVLFVLPGLIGIVLLHPYPYIYYNSFVGGVRGAEGNFETDYWLTSYREATNYLNANAPTGSRILVLYAGFNVEHNARRDLQVGSLESGIYDSDADKMIRENYDYVIIPTRYDANITFLPNAEVIYEVRKNGVLLCVIKKVNK